MQLGVVGTGHVGLVTCVTFAEFGHEVVATDEDQEKLGRLESGEAPFFEPGLQELLDKHRNGPLTFSHDKRSLTDAEAVFICVGTPPRATGEANLAAVENSARELAEHARGRTLIVEKSTVPAGTATRLRRVLRHARPDLENDLEVVSNPEFLREGAAIEDSLNPSRILVGADSEWARERMRDVYRPLLERGVELIETDIATAELSKHACNAFLALKISYINAIARLCERAGADVELVASVLGSDERIGPHFLKAGLGFGGSCFPKDLRAFDKLAHELGYDFALLRDIDKVNDEAVEAAVAKIADALWNLEGKRVALLGLAFKPGTDDVRFSPALELARKLIDRGATVVGYDPHAGSPAKAEVPEIEIAPSVEDAITDSHCLVLATEWPEFREVDLEKARSAMAYPVIVDARNFLDGESCVAAGFTYLPVGRPALAPGA
ncbi:MAG: UDP-glucose/GDP-mannose dehydrogenase family protein [Actinomycetota bacterium]|nr:UDP-glucose/GDP-mannose dehydrogenase family protein [Actinomycetota bacterium]